MSIFRLLCLLTILVSLTACDDDDQGAGMWVQLSPRSAEGSAWSAYEFQATVHNAAGNLLYIWDFGDHTVIDTLRNTGTASHIFYNPGTYTVRLTVRDETDPGRSAGTSLPVTITVPQDGHHYARLSIQGNGYNQQTLLARAQSAAPENGGERTALAFQGYYGNLPLRLRITFGGATPGTYIWEDSRQGAQATMLELEIVTRQGELGFVNTYRSVQGETQCTEYGSTAGEIIAGSFNGTAAGITDETISISNATFQAVRTE